jgi:hypothetical protein
MDKGGAPAAFQPRGLSQIGQENPRVPTSPGPDDDELLFRCFFDWDLYCNSTQTQDHLVPSSSPHTNYRELPKLMTEIPFYLHNLSLDGVEDGYMRMTPGLSPDDGGITTSESMGQTPPALVRGGSTSPSSPSSSVYLDGVEDVRRRPRDSLPSEQVCLKRIWIPAPDPGPRVILSPLKPQQDALPSVNLWCQASAICGEEVQTPLRP